MILCTMSDNEDEDDIAINKAEFYNIYAHVDGKEIRVSCGDATQRLKWLAHVAIGQNTFVRTVFVIRDS